MTESILKNYTRSSIKHISASLVFLLMLIPIQISGQDKDVLYEIRAETSFFSTDPDSNIYFVSGDSLCRINFRTGKHVSFYFQPREVPGFVDTSNPDNILVLFRYF